MSTFGFLTIGQSPRTDILDSMFDLDPGSAIVQHGALDDLTLNQIRELLPAEGESLLVTRLRDGTEVLVSKPRLIPHLRRAADRALADGATALVMLCTGTFPDLDATAPIIYPDRLLHATVNALLPTGTIGVVMPHIDQMESMRQKWRLPGRDFMGTSASPYSSADQLSQVGRELGDGKADLIVLDCMGFTSDMKRDVASESGVPVILANRLVGRILEELMESTPIERATSGT